MKDRLYLRKTAVALAVVVMLSVIGIFGASSVTAWADSATVNTEGANVRASAVDGESLDTLPEGKSVEIVDSTTGSDGNVWYYIEYTSAEMELSGWIRSDLLNTSEATEILTEAEEAEAAAEEAAAEAEAAAEEAVTSEEEAQAAAETATEEAENAENQEAAAASGGAVSYVISSSIPADVIPDGFQKTTVSYEGKDVQALVMNNAEVYLLYMEDTSGTAPGRLVVYDLSKSELIPYICFDTEDGFILLLNIPDAELSSVSDRFALTTCEFDEGTMDALQMTQKDSAISESANLTDFYFMYGVNRDGMYGWYVYDAAEGMIEESIMSMHYNLAGTEEEEVRSGFSLDSLSTVVIVGIIVIFLLLLILVIIFGVRYRQLANEVDAMEERRASRRSSGSRSGSGSGPRSRSSSKGDGAPADGDDSSQVSQETQDFEFFSEINNEPTEPLQNATLEAPEKTSGAPKGGDDDDDLEFL